MKRLFATLLVLALALGMFVGCSGDGDDNDTNSGDNAGVTDAVLSTADVNYLSAEGESVYRIVRPEGDEAVNSCAQYLFKQMKEILGVSVRNTLDTANDGTDTYEILLGDVNRPEVAQAKDYLVKTSGGRYDDFAICTIGKKIVIYGESDAAMDSAVKYFVTNYVKAEGVKGGIAYAKATEGSFETITVNGVDVGRFDFVRPHYNSSYLTEVEMEEIVETVYAKTGYMMSIVHDTKVDPAEYEIIVGNTTREGVEAVADYDQFKITVKGKKVYINGGSAHATAMGVSEFAKMLTGDIKDSNSVIGSYETAMNSYDKSTNFYWTWGDDFDGETLDTTKWRQVIDPEGRATGQNGKTSIRSGNPNDVFVSDGKFYICAREDDTTYYGGMIKTDRTMSYKYGYAEMSSIIPQGDSFWIAWWACSNDGTATFDPSETKILSPEIDIVECFGNSSYYAANCHSWPTTYGVAEYGLEHTSLDGAEYGKLKQYTSVDEGVVLGDDFHTYGFLWDNTKMAFTCDGDLFFSYDTTTTFEDMECFNHSMYFIYSMALAFADAPGNPITQNPDEWVRSNKLVLDWMHLYQKDDGLHELNWTGAQ